MSIALPSYRYQPGIGNFGDASMGDAYVLFPKKLNDSDDVSNYGYNSTLYNKTAQYGSRTDPGNVEQTSSVAYWGRRSWHGGSDRNRFGQVPPVFTSLEEYQNYIAARLAEEDDLTNNWVYVNNAGAGISNSMYQVYPRWNFQGSAKWPWYHTANYPRLSGLYDTDLAVNTPLIQIGYVSQQAWLHLNNGITTELHPQWFPYTNFTNAGSLRFKAVNESFFFQTSNPAAPQAAERAKIYERMYQQILQNIHRYKRYYSAGDRQSDHFGHSDSKVERYYYARNKVSQLDLANLGFAGDVSNGSNWNKVNRRIESLDAWMYVSGSYNITTKEFTLNPNYLYFRLANAQTGVFNKNRLPTDSDAKNGVIYK